MKIKKSSNVVSDIDTDLITGNNFFAHLIKAISITRYGHEKQFILNDKHLPKESLKKIEKTVLFSKQPVYFNKTTIDRRIHDGSGAGTSGTNAKIAARKANEWRQRFKYR